MKDRRCPLDLRVCLLEDNDTLQQDGKSPSGRCPTCSARLLNVVISLFFMSVFKFPIQNLSCPRGLQEPDFLDLLRSTFPQLTEQFEVFTADETGTLTPLRLQTLTPEEIRKSIRSTRRSTLYVRAKVERPLPASDVHHVTERLQSVS